MKNNALGFLAAVTIFSFYGWAMACAVAGELIGF